MRGTISREHPWEVMPDLYFYRDPEEVGASWQEVCLSEMFCLCSYLVCLLSRTSFANIMIALHSLMWWLVNHTASWCLLSDT